MTGFPRLISTALSLALHAAALGAVLHWLPPGTRNGASGNSPEFTVRVGLTAAPPAEESGSVEAPMAELPAPPAAPLPATAEAAYLVAAREGPAPAAARKPPASSRKKGGSGGTGHVSPPSYAFAPAPLYPETLRRSRAKGWVLLEVQVTAQGTPGQVRIKRSSGHPAMDQAALDGVHVWKFHPARNGTEPVCCWVEVPVRFDLKGN